MRRLFPIFVLILVVLATFSACTKSGTAIVQDKQEYTIDDQRTIGDHLSNSIKSNTAEYDIINANAFPEVYDYLNQMLKSAVITEQVVMRDEFTWEIFPLIDEEQAFAYSTPGGKIVISTAMLKSLQYESELLALLSAEIYYTDVDLHTAALRDEFSGIRLGSIALGTDTRDPADLIEFLRNRSFTETEVFEADRRAIAVMCPFNYDVKSLQELVQRTQSGTDMSYWNERRQVLKFCRNHFFL